MTEARDPAGHIKSGVQGLVSSVADGFFGVFTKPLTGAAEYGFSGALSGIVKGVVGAVTKPVAGVFDLASAASAAVRLECG